MSERKTKKNKMNTINKWISWWMHQLTLFPWSLPFSDNNGRFGFEPPDFSGLECDDLLTRDLKLLDFFDNLSMSVVERLFSPGKESLLVVSVFPTRGTCSPGSAFELVLPPGVAGGEARSAMVNSHVWEVRFVLVRVRQWELRKKRKRNIWFSY